MKDKRRVVELKEGEAVYNKADVEGLLEALRFTLDITNEAYSDYISARWIAGSGFNNNAQYSAGHNKHKIDTARQALKNWERGEGDK